ncbi:hypothetical protein FACS189472_18300 [Alphaproteobacteria bacterium]|nr:hypothetical protein FACS189472_18300 [Alphaproteobacteria bacterium]
MNAINFDNAELLRTEIRILKKSVDDLSEENEDLEAVTYENSVRSKNNNNVLKIVENKGRFKVSADNNNNPVVGSVVATYVFPAPILIRKDIRFHFNKPDIRPVFERKELPALKAHIERLIPKN